MLSSDPLPLERARARLNGKTAAILGFAREGLDLARFLPRAGASVRLIDRKPAEQFESAIANLAAHSVSFWLGSDDNPAVLDGSDVLFVSPGVPPEHPLVRMAVQRGIPVTSLIELLFELCPAPTIGITGSAGKTTTTSLVGAMFRADGRDVFVGGNIGRPLLSEVERMTPESWVVLELSSFQLEAMRRSPHVATVTNVTPNHLDRHPTMEAYWEAKGHILAYQGDEDWAILNADDPWSRRYQARGRLMRFSLTQAVEGAFVRDGQVYLLDSPLMPVSDVPLRGEHNVANVLAAAATAHAAGVSRSALAEAVRTFHAVPHRLEPVAERRGVLFVNDSIATSPERSIAALKSYREPIVLIAGGRDKHLPMEDWARIIVERASHVVLIGEMSGLVAAALRNVSSAYAVVSWAADMDEAVALAAQQAPDGAVVLLSPGGTSFDQYQDFEARGRDFARAALALPEATPPVHPDQTASGRTV